MANINVVGDFIKSGLSRKDLKGVVEAVFDVLDKEKKINIAFVEDKDIQKKNLEYRKVDNPTDVLSFDYGDEGDILLCLDIIDKYKEGDTLKDSVIKTLIHGSLHIFGYDHEKDEDHAIMKKIEVIIFDKIKEKRHSGD